MTTASEIAKNLSDDELDRYWAHTPQHPDGCTCRACELRLRTIRLARANGLKCSCREADGVFCDVHGITLCNG